MQLEHPTNPLGPCPVEAVRAALPATEDPVWDSFAMRQAKYDAHNATRSIVIAWTDLLLGGKPVVFAPDHAAPILAEAVRACGERIAAQFPGGTIVKLMLAVLLALIVGTASAEPGSSHGGGLGAACAKC